MALRRTAELMVELTTTIARQGRSGHAGGGKRSDWPLPVDLDAVEVAWVIGNTLSAWADHCAQARGLIVPDRGGPALLALWMVDQLEWLRHRPEAAQAAGELEYACRELLHTIDRHSSACWYAGPCGAMLAGDGGTCLVDVYARAGSEVARCPGCGTQHDVPKRRDWLLGVAREELMHAEALAAAVTAFGMPATGSQIRNWASRRRLWARAEDQYGRPTYRVGDVLDLLAERAQAQARREARKSRKAA